MPAEFIAPPAKDVLNCSSHDFSEISSFVNSTDPGYFTHRYTYIAILLALAGLGTTLNLSMIIFLLKTQTNRYSMLHGLVSEFY